MKKFTLLLLLVVCFTLALTGCGGDKKADVPKDGGKKEQQVLNIYSWADFFDPQVLAAFEKANNCRVNYDVYSNNEELLAKMQAGGAQFDIIQPSDYMVTTMIHLDMLEKLDHSKLPNVQANLIESLKHPAYDPKQEYAIPYVWGITGIAYNKKYVKDPITSWADLWKPEYKGHIILLNDNREVFSLALKKLGKSNNSTDAKEVEAAFNDLKKLNTNVLAYDGENIKQKMIAEEAWIAQMWSSDASFCNFENPNIQFCVPKEGTSIWADNMAIPKGAKNKELAMKFLNYIYDPQVSAQNFNYMRVPSPNAKAIPLQKKEVVESPILKAVNSQAGKGEWIQDIGNAITMYDKYWTELKTGSYRR